MIIDRRIICDLCKRIDPCLAECFTVFSNLNNRGWDRGASSDSREVSLWPDQRLELRNDLDPTHEFHFCPECAHYIVWPALLRFRNESTDWLSRAVIRKGIK